MLTRRDVMRGLLGGAAAGAWPGHLGAADAPGNLVAAAGLGGDVGYCLADARTGAVLEAWNAGAALPPASTAKVLTSGFALARLGEDHRFVTRVLATGPLAGGIVQGDLVLAGTGDPELDTDSLGDLVARLAGLGLRGVTGGFVFDDRALPRLPEIATDQPAHVGYNPGLSGLNLNYNRVNFEWRHRGADVSTAMTARGERFVPVVDLARMRVVERDRPVFRREGGEDWSVARSALARDGSRWLPVAEPGPYAAAVFRTLCAGQGIALPPPRRAGQMPAGAAVLADLPGAPLTDVLRRMLRWSTNLTAEVVGLTASGAGGLVPSARAMDDWVRARLGAEARMVDHSGLGAASRIAAGQMVQALVALRRLPEARALPAVLRDLGLKDEDGALLRGPVKVLGKTGTLNFVSGLVGYIFPPKGRDLAFAIYCADVARRDALPMDDREQPPGGKAWLRRARGLQAKLVARWAEGFV